MTPSERASYESNLAKQADLQQEEEDKGVEGREGFVYNPTANTGTGNDLPSAA